MTNKQKKYAHLILLSILSFFCYSYSAVLSIPERQGPPGAVIQLPIKFSDASLLAGGEFKLQFDEDILEYQDLEMIGVADSFLVVSKVEDEQVGISMARAIGLQQTMGTLFSLKFRIRQSAALGTATEITWVENRLYDETTTLISCDVAHGVVKVSDIVVFPDPFTPNGDGYNDAATFVIPDSITSEVSVKIYSVSGSKIREFTKNSNSQLQWDGKNDQGETAQPGVYLYLILADSKVLSKGSITIMR